MKWMSGIARLLLAAPACVARDNGLQRMYVLDCGRLIAKDQSRWTPGINAGQPREMSNNCYLLVHRRGTLLWETGVSRIRMATTLAMRRTSGSRSC
jgi:hypothetical protein